MITNHEVQQFEHEGVVAIRQILSTQEIESLKTAVTSIAEVARHDGASGWCVMIAGTTSLLAGFLPEEYGELIYGPNNSCTGGFAAPVGKAKVVDGGLSVTGTWEWGSGSQHCTWIGGGTRILGEDEKPIKRDDGLFAPFVFIYC